MYRTYRAGDLFRIASDGAELRTLATRDLQSRPVAELNEGDTVMIVALRDDNNSVVTGWVKVLTRRGMGWVSQNALVEHDLVEE